MPEPEPQVPAYKIDFQIRFDIDFFLACEMADIIIASGTKNPALWSLAKKIKDQEARG